MESIEPRKLFVGGVSRETTEDTLREHFSQYGTVVESLIIRQRLTGLERGFGFVIFSSISMAEETLQHDNHVILGKKVEVKRAIPKCDKQEDSNGYNSSSHNGNGVTGINTKKIFVGGLPLDIKAEEFKCYFESFGTIKDAIVIPDKVTSRPRGFGFITFDSEDAVEIVLRNRFHKLKNKMVEVKRAHPKDRNDEYMNYYDCNNTNLGLGCGFLYSYNNIYYCYGWSSYGFGGWGSPSNLIGSLPGHGLLASGNPGVHNSYIFYPSYGVCMNCYCNGNCNQMGASTVSGSSIDEHQEEEMDDSLSSKSNAAEHQIAEIHDSTVQTPMPQSTNSEQNGPSSHDIPSCTFDK